MTLMATPQRPFEMYGTGSVSPPPHMFPAVLLSDNQLLISFASLSLPLACLYFLTFSPFGSIHVSCWTRDNRNWFGRVTLTVDHHSLGSTFVKAIFILTVIVFHLLHYLPYTAHVSHILSDFLRVWYQIKSRLAHKCCSQLISSITLENNPFFSKWDVNQD